MDQLQQARAQIDEIDAKMAALFEQRMQAVGQVAQYKARTGKQVFDPAREALVLEKNTARVQNPELQPYYREFLKKALAVSRAYQHVLIGQDVAAYQGAVLKVTVEADTLAKALSHYRLGLHVDELVLEGRTCLLYTSPSPRDCS